MKIEDPQSSSLRDRCSITFSVMPPVEQLESEWRELDAHSAGSVFLSWPWIATAFTNPDPDTVLARITCGPLTIGLGLLGLNKRRFLLWHKTSLHLNETGDPTKDQVMCEYNGLLTIKGREQEATEAFLTGLNDSKPYGGRDLHLSGVTGLWNKLCPQNGWKTRLLRVPQIAPFAALQSASTDDPLAALSRNSRQQIRRSLRFYETQNPLSIKRADTEEQALAWLDDLETLHTKAWNRRGKKGAFSDPSFRDFHRRLISTTFSEGVTDLLRVQSGETVLGYLYNLRWRDVVYAYQSGFQFEQAPDARPGLVCHVLAMGLYREEGMATYRFLAGDARYKNSLATGTDELFWIKSHHSGLYGIRPYWIG